jgi:hypothetical protein
MLALGRDGDTLEFRRCNSTAAAADVDPAALGVDPVVHPPDLRRARPQRPARVTETGGAAKQAARPGGPNTWSMAVK